MAIALSLACGESSKQPVPDSEHSGGLSGSVSAGGSSGGAGNSARAGSQSSAGGGLGGSAATSSSGSAGRGDSGRGGSSAGTSSSGGAGGSFPESWDAACGDVTPNGECSGDVYQWCDYFTRSLKTVDCAALDMSCVAAELQPQEADLNGCVGDPCSGLEDHCAGRLAYQCRSDGMHVVDCAQKGGSQAICMLTEAGYARCQSREPCNPQSSFRCDGKLSVICDEEGYLHFQDCARCNPEGVCVEGGGETHCDPPFLSCED